MNRHLTDEQILDLVAAGAEPTEEIREHLATCPRCRSRLEAERPLSDRLDALPREADPPRDLWPDVRNGIAVEIQDADTARIGRLTPSRGWARPALRAAAVVALFLLGAVVGRWSGTGETGTERVVSDDPLVAAAEVQRSGTEYVAAVARFRATARDAPSATVDQAWDVALAAVHGAAWELERLRPDDATARGIVALADRDLAGEVAP